MRETPATSPALVSHGKTLAARRRIVLAGHVAFVAARRDLLTKPSLAAVPAALTARVSSATPRAAKPLARGESRTDRLAAFFNIGDLGFQCVVAHGADDDVLADHIGGRPGHLKRFG